MNLRNQSARVAVIALSAVHPSRSGAHQLALVHGWSTVFCGNKDDDRQRDQRCLSPERAEAEVVLKIWLVLRSNCTVPDTAPTANRIVVPAAHRLLNSRKMGFFVHK